MCIDLCVGMCTCMSVVQYEHQACICTCMLARVCAEVYVSVGGHAGIYVHAQALCVCVFRYMYVLA